MFNNHSEYMQYIATEMDVEERNRNSGFKDEYEIRGFLDRAMYLRFLTHAYPAESVYELSNKLGSQHDFGELITQLKKLKNNS